MANQRGQAIVLIALMLTVIIGMAAIAIDGSRAYALRRDLQGAVDAAALAAGDTLQQTGNWSSAERAAANIFAANLRVYSGPACGPLGAPGASAFTVSCTYLPDTAVITVVAQGMGPQGSQFTVSGQRNLQLQFARILTNGSSPAIASSSTGSVNNLRYSPAVSALDQAGCGGVPGTAITVGGGGTLSVVGDVVSNGTVTLGAATLKVSGDLYARCQPVVPGAVTMACYPSGAATPCTYPDVAGATRAGFRLGDPHYPPPAIVGGSQPLPGSDVVLSPGLYAADPAFATNRCYFLASGVYDWQAGYTNSGGFVSNELKPPDEPNAGDTTSLGHQMWDTGGVNCSGSFQPSAISSAAAIREGTWAVEVTATRTDTFNGINYFRESAPSMCRSVVIGDLQALKVTVSNVPGATGYRVYAAPPNNGCAGPLGYAGSITVSGPVRNDNTAGCPAFSGSTCSLGYVSATFDASVLGLTFTPRVVAPGIIGAPPPVGETPPLRVNLPNQNPDRGTPPAGDRANENQCSTVVGVATACPAAVTPGAVEFYIPAGGCLNATTDADNFLFSGYQYNWIMLYEPGASNPPANTCANVLGAAADSAWVGLMYTPAAALTISKAATFRTEATGGLMADTVTFTGQLPTIIYSPSYAPVPPATRLTG